MEGPNFLAEESHSHHRVGGSSKSVVVGDFRTQKRRRLSKRGDPFAGIGVETGGPLWAGVKTRVIKTFSLIGEGGGGNKEVFRGKKKKGLWELTKKGKKKKGGETNGEKHYR